MNRTLFLAIITFIFSSCTKENSNEFITDPNNSSEWVTTISPIAPVNQIFQILSAPSEDSSFDADTGGTISFPDQVQIIFPQKAFGAGVSGKLKLELHYLRTKGDMIRFGKPTTSGENFLISGGSFDIKVSQNGRLLQIEPGKGVAIRYPYSPTDPDMNLFYGDTTINSTDGFTWTASIDTLPRKPIYIWEQQGTIFHTGYTLLSKKCRWINCDHYADFNNLSRTKITTTLPANFTNNNSGVFLAFRDIFCVARMNADVGNHLFYTKDIPIGKDIVIVSISKIGTDFYLAAQEVKVTENINVELSPEKKTEQEVIDYLNSL